MEKWKITGIMSKESYINKMKDLPEFVRQFLGFNRFDNSYNFIIFNFK